MLRCLETGVSLRPVRKPPVSGRVQRHDVSRRRSPARDGREVCRTISKWNEGWRRRRLRRQRQQGFQRKVVGEFLSRSVPHTQTPARATRILLRGTPGGVARNSSVCTMLGPPPPRRRVLCLHSLWTPSDVQGLPTFHATQKNKVGNHVPSVQEAVVAAACLLNVVGIVEG